MKGCAGLVPVRLSSVMGLRSLDEPPTPSFSGVTIGAFPFDVTSPIVLIDAKSSLETCNEKMVLSESGKAQIGDLCPPDF